MTGPELYLHFRKASHFLRWEVPEFAKYFTLVSAPSRSAILLSFGPDVLEEAATLPARARFAVLFPGFSYNPVRDTELRSRQLRLFEEAFTQIFINPGPLEIAYEQAKNLTLYPFSVDTALVGFRHYRTGLNSLLHVSHDNPQKDWPRSESIMKKTGLAYEVFPPRDQRVLESHVRMLNSRNATRARFGLTPKPILPVGYYSHEQTVRKYHEHDGFVHVAREVGHPEFIDGKYTASLMEAGLTGAILFWHDTWGLGNGLETVFDLPLATQHAADRILEIRQGLDVTAHSRRTREEMLDTFNPHRSVSIRAKRMLALL